MPRTLGADTPPRHNIPPLIALAVGSAMVIALIYFDLQTTIAYNDDWIYSWEVRHSTLLHPRLWPFQSIGLVQIWWALLVTPPGHDMRLLRLALVPLVLLAAFASYRSATILGASRFWAAAVASTLLTAPLYMALAATFMTDVVFVALVLAAAWQGLRWLTSGRGMIAFTLFGAFACIQRPVGLALAPALAVGYLSISEKPSRTQAGNLQLVGNSGALIAATLVPSLVAGGSLLKASAFLPGINGLAEVKTVAYLPLMVGLLLTPFAGGLLTRRRVAGRVARRHTMVAAAVPLVLAGVAVAWFLSQGSYAFPGNVWTPAGLAPTPLGGAKVPVLPGALFAGVAALATATALTLAVADPDRWTRRRLGAGGVFLVALTVFEFAPLTLIGTAHPVFDRYFLPVAAPLIPLAGSWATSSGRIGQTWALCALTLGGAIWIASELDYVASTVAIDLAAAKAYAVAPPEQVHAGTDENAVHVEIPYYDRTGRLPEHAGDPQRDETVTGPSNPRIVLAYALAGDPRPGVDYSSVVSGRIVLEYR